MLICFLNSCLGVPYCPPACPNGDCNDVSAWARQIQLPGRSYPASFKLRSILELVSPQFFPNDPQILAKQLLLFAFINLTICSVTPGCGIPLPQPPPPQLPRYGGTYMIYINGRAPFGFHSCVTTNLLTKGCSCPAGYNPRFTGYGGLFMYAEWDLFAQRFTCEMALDADANVNLKVLTFFQFYFRPRCFSQDPVAVIRKNGSFMQFISGRNPWPVLSCPTPNLLTGACSCPLGYTAMFNSYGGLFFNSPWDQFARGYSCERVDFQLPASEGSEANLPFIQEGGFYMQYLWPVLSCPTPNLLTGACSCPLGYTAMFNSYGGLFFNSPWDQFARGYTCERVVLGTNSSKGSAVHADA